MRRAFRIALSVAKWLAIVGGALVAVVLLVNSRDQELTPEARALAEHHLPSVPDAQNAYLAMVGFDAPAGVDPIARGASLVVENNVTVASDPEGWGRMSKLAAKDSKVESEGRLKFVGDLDALPDPVDRPCLPQALERADDIRSMIDANEVLVARYLAMQRLSAFVDTSSPDILSSIPPSAGWGGSRRLLLMKSCLDAQTGQVGRALAFLAADNNMWRRILGNGAMIDEMIAVRGVASNLRILSGLIAAPTFDVRTHEEKVRQILVPFTAVELDVSPMIAREFELQMKLITELPEETAKFRNAGWVDRLINGPLFFKPNATVNLSVPLFAGLLTLARNPPSDFVRLREKLLSDKRAMSAPGVTWIYNPIGHLTFGMSIPVYPEYVARVFDLAAYLQLIQAQLELRLAVVHSDQVPEFLAAAGSETRNPYTGQPFQWSASDSTLSFEPMSSGWRRWSIKAAVPLPN